MKQMSILRERALHSWGLTGMRNEPDKAVQDTLRLTEANANMEAKEKEKEQQVIVCNLMEKSQQAEHGCSQLAKELAELKTVRTREVEDSRE